MVVTLLLLCIGLLLTGYAFFLLLRRRRLLAAGINGLVALPFLLIGGFFSLLLLNQQTYRQLTHEVILAEVRLGQTTGQGVPLRLAYGDQMETFYIRSPQWRLDARFVKWKPWLSLLGKEPIVRLERLAERRGTGDADAVLKRYDLQPDRLGADAWVSALSEEIGLVDSVYGSSVYMPATPGAEYQVSATISGLLARPANPRGEQAVIEWSRR
jgi:hypothetical protein